MVEIFLDNVTHIYGKEVKALDSTTLRVENGSLIALLGPSGCGKTTTMRIIAGLLRPTSGRVYFDNVDVTERSSQERNVAMVFQFIVIYDKTVFENIEFPLLVRKVPKEERIKRVKHAAELMGISNVLNQQARKLDPGTRQKVALARAFVRQPTVFLLDEPLTNVDPQTRLELRKIIKELQKDLHQTMIYVTHDQAEALTLSEKIAVMKDGKMIQYDTPEALYDKPKNTFVAWFIGNPGMQFFDVSLKQSDGAFLLDAGEFSVDVSNVSGQLVKYGNELKLGIRPENIQVSSQKKVGWFNTKCTMVERVGNMHLLTLGKGRLEIKAKIKETDVREGDTAWVQFPSEKVRVYSKAGELII
ncbi:MAG: ABC transporter ATP-binding protein [Nitrososphaeria archaeon]